MLWVWLVGLVVLALLIWGIAELVNTDRDNQTMAAGDSANAPAGASAPDGTAAEAPATEEAPGPASLEDLLPLGAQDVGQQVAASGTVLTTPGPAGFWLYAGANTVVWVRGNLKGITQGQAVQGILGILRQAAPADMSTWVGATDIQKATARHPYWQTQTALYVDASAPAAPAAPVRTAADTSAGKTAGHRGRTTPAGHRRPRR